MWSKFGNCSISIREVIIISIYKDLTRKTAFFEGWSWFKFNNLGLALGTNLKFYTNVAKGLKLKVTKCWGLIATFVEVAWEKLIDGEFLPPILYRVKIETLALVFSYEFCKISKNIFFVEHVWRLLLNIRRYFMHLTWRVRCFVKYSILKVSGFCYNKNRKLQKALLLAKF